MGIVLQIGCTEALWWMEKE